MSIIDMTVVLVSLLGRLLTGQILGSIVALLEIIFTASVRDDKFSWNLKTFNEQNYKSAFDRKTINKVTYTI